ncbi:MAG TPA: rRNA pseudouridine synthase [Anaerolineae bacterium]|nr:rRNA pseudouridine synthase [Anaerolineae bacterium]
MTQERLQKLLAHAGVASRRACEKLILQGRVRVNGETVTRLGTKVDPERDQVEVDGEPVRIAPVPKWRYIILHKPRGYLSEMEGVRGQRALRDLVDVPERVYSVGRLDQNSEGLVLLTNDGALAHRLTHPRYEHEKEYLVLVEGRPSSVAIHRLRRGVELPDGRTAPAQVALLPSWPGELPRAWFNPALGGDGPLPNGSWLRITLREGRKRQIRHMTAAVGHPTLRLIRVRIGPLRLGMLRPGAWRDLTPNELRRLRGALRGDPPKRRRGGRRDGG